MTDENEILALTNELVTLVTDQYHKKLDNGFIEFIRSYAFAPAVSEDWIRKWIIQCHEWETTDPAEAHYRLRLEYLNRRIRDLEIRNAELASKLEEIEKLVGD